MAPSQEFVSCSDVTSCLSPASNHLPQQQTAGKTSSSSKVSQLHLPHLASRHSIKHLSSSSSSSSITRANQIPRQLPSRGGTGRREAVTVPRDHRTSHLGIRTSPRAAVTVSRGFRVSTATVSKVTVSKVSLDD